MIPPRSGTTGCRPGSAPGGWDGSTWRSRRPGGRSRWTDIYSTTTGTGGVQTLQVSGSGRYVRMYGTHRATQYGYSLWEFQVFGT
jgi:hypothetical protein